MTLKSYQEKVHMLPCTIWTESFFFFKLATTFQNVTSSPLLRHQILDFLAATTLHYTDSSSPEKACCWYRWDKCEAPLTERWGLGAAEYGTHGGKNAYDLHHWRTGSIHTSVEVRQQKTCHWNAMIRLRQWRKYIRDTPVIAKGSCAGITHITGNNVMSHQQNAPRLPSWWLSPGASTTHSVHFINRRQQSKVQPRILFPPIHDSPLCQCRDLAPHNHFGVFCVLWKQCGDAFSLVCIFNVESVTNESTAFKESGFKWKSSDLIESFL